MFESLLANVGEMLGTTGINAGILLSIILSFMVIITVIIVSQGAKNSGTLGVLAFLLMTVFFTALGWYPIWLGAVLGLGIGIITAWYLSNIGKSAG